jgi:hypothetical protein
MMGKIMLRGDAVIYILLSLSLLAPAFLGYHHGSLRLVVAWAFACAVVYFWWSGRTGLVAVLVFMSLACGFLVVHLSTWAIAAALRCDLAPGIATYCLPVVK